MADQYISRNATYTLGSYRLSNSFFENTPLPDIYNLLRQGEVVDSKTHMQAGTLQYRGSYPECVDIPEYFKWEKRSGLGKGYCQYKNPAVDCKYLVTDPGTGQSEWVDCAYFGAHTFLEVQNLPGSETFLYASALPVSENFLEQISETVGTQNFLESVGPVDITRLFEIFEFLVEIIPIPFSIRNSPDTNIWIRLRDPSAPLNLDTLVMYVNGEDISQSSNLTKNRVVNGVEILYNPPEDFDYESLVYVEFFITTTNSWETSFKNPAPIGTQFITINADARTMNPGAILTLGPNNLSETENVEIVNVVDEDQLQVTELTYEYSIGDTITYFELGSTALSYKYWFEIIPDYRPPWFENLYPIPEQTGLSTLTPISFDIKDTGRGVDISSLVFRVNDLDVTPTKIYKYSNTHYRIYYQPTKEFYYNAFVYVFVRVNDLAAQHNYAIEYWRFKTEAADTPMLTGFMPECCANPVSTMTDVMFEIYGKYSGIDLDSLIITIDGVNYPLEFWPKIYRSE